jgi:heat shock protein HslJ
VNTKYFYKISLAILSFSILLAACSSSTGQKKTVTLEPLYSGSWHLVAYGNEEGTSIVTPGLQSFGVFQEDGGLSGNAGCNNYFGTFKASEDGSFSIEGPLGSTLMFCEAFMDDETAFLTALQSADAFSFNESGQLVINISDPADGYAFMVFVNQKTVPFLSTGWVLSSLVTPDGEIDVPPASAPVIIFPEDGNMTGNGGCNQLSSEFTSGEGTISIGEIATTMMYCEDVMDVEAGFTAGLAQVTRYEITGDRRLVLSDEQYTTVLTFFTTEFMLEQTQWRLYVLTGEEIPEIINVTLTLSPEGKNREGTVFGSAGCNRYSGTYSLNEDRLTVNVLAVTAMMCDASMETEDAFLAALQDELTFQIQFNRLILTSENNTLLFLGEQTSMAGNWRLNRLGPPENPEDITFEQTILADFMIGELAATGLITGTTPCQTYTARFFIDWDFIKFGSPEMIDLDQCEETSEIETQYFEALQNAAQYKFSQGNLILFDGEGNQLLEFSAQY